MKTLKVKEIHDNIPHHVAVFKRKNPSGITLKNGYSQMAIDAHKEGSLWHMHSGDSSVVHSAAPGGYVKHFNSGEFTFMGYKKIK